MPVSFTQFWSRIGILKLLKTFSVKISQIIYFLTNSKSIIHANCYQEQRFCNGTLIESRDSLCPNPENFSIQFEYDKPKTDWHLNFKVNPLV